MIVVPKTDLVQLATDIAEDVWPGDTAVDLERSDVLEWARLGGSAGLVIKPGEKPTVIRWRSLSEQGLRHVLRALGSPNMCDEAARWGITGIKGLELRWERPWGDIRGLSDESLRLLGSIRCELPTYHLDRLVSEATGLEFDAPPADDLVPTSLSRAVGAHILARSFRERRPTP